MKLIIIGLCLLILVTSQRISINDQNCNKYLQKFGTANNPDGTGATKIAFTGDVAFITNSTSVKVKLRYSDVDLFNDPTYFGLVQEDGKKAETTCLDLKLWKFTSNTYSDPVQVTDLPITNENNNQKQWRYYSFTIPGDQLGSKLVVTQNSAQFIYKGYFAIAYYAAGTDQVQYTFYFEFQVTVDKASGASVDTAFKPLSQSSTLGCTPSASCNTKADTVLKWCTDLTCTKFSTPDLHLNDQFVLLQQVTTLGMDYYLVGTEVWYTGNGLNKKAIIISINNSKKGQVIIQLKAEIAWTGVTIKATSTLSTTQGRRILVQTTFDTVSGETEEITCIKAEGADTCPTCQQEKNANGFYSDNCKGDVEEEDDEVKHPSSNGFTLFGFFTLLLFAII
ncbi:unnamed protein product (macronuclear) [Paramecium tetraurelia]|uniref:Uncharacterized protein n=1 Tax=Paramecium tetraurelia TaxID=5888 RepID=A0EBW4_PARTE|nr:uncharacterized protein GSPATT00025516001 [Paramecium tetraurelia]CAK92781.1 unnamed protein product [Paramecium tetraurelia]|eukprot:XP_001460178.1 hypothetical protein (macronuclear) [Paramecium tetraurelia strain d4-2]